MISESAPAITSTIDSTGNPSESRGSNRPAREVGSTETAVSDNLSEAEQAVWRDPDLLARIEAVLDDPSLAVPLDETASSHTTAANRTDTPSECQEP